MRTLLVLLFVCIATTIAIRSPFRREIHSNQFAIKLQTGVNPEQVASEHSLTYNGPLGVLPDWYLFNAPFRMILPTHIEKLKVELASDSRIIDFDQQISRASSVKQNVKFNDPLFSQQWNLNNTGQNGATRGNDINVYPVWNAQVSGKSVLFQVVDDGLDFSNAEFAHYVPSASFNLVTNSKNPSPLSSNDTHGTMVAGVAVALGNNKICGVGVAYSASISAINYVKGSNVTDFNTARAQTEWALATGVDVSINSWGTLDSGNTITRTGSSIANVVEEGRQFATSQGRRGKGIVIVWAAGNGNLENDNCNYDMLSQSPYIITVTSSNANGTWSSYSELCAANFINAPSSDLAMANLPAIITPSTGSSSCTQNFGGTSASTPTVAGVTGLMLDVNANLTYRDVMHILVRTAFQNDPSDSSWSDNFVGIPHSYKYGFGRVNAAAAVSAARNWTLVDPLKVVRTVKDFPYLAIISNGATFTRTINAEISGSLEHVNLYVNIDHKFPNELTVILVSPSGTISMMAPSFNAGPRPVIYLNETYFAGTYATFSKLVPTQGIRFSGISVVFANESCHLPDDDLSDNVALYIYRDGCDVGQIALQAQALGAVSVWVNSDLTTITGVVGAIIPVFRVEQNLAAAIMSTDFVGGGSIHHTKVPVYGNYRNNYRMMTVRCWGENPYGRWELRLIDNTAGDNGLLEDWNLEFFGNIQRVVDPVTEIDFFGSSSSTQPSSFLLILSFVALFGLWMLA